MGPILVAAKQYLESVAWGYTCNNDETVLTTELSGTNATYTVNMVADDRWGWFTCYVIPKTTIPPSAVPIVAEYLARVNFANFIGDFEIDHSDGAFLYKTNVLAGVGDVPSQGAFASAINPTSIAGLDLVGYATARPDRSGRAVARVGGDGKLELAS